MKRLLVASLAVLVSYAQVNLTTTGPTKTTGASTIAGVPAGAEPPVSSPMITTATPLPDGDQDVPYTLNLLATGGVLPYSWSLVATETLPQATEVWTPASGAMALTETFGDPDCSATDNVWPTPAGLVIDATGKLTGNCSGTINGVDSAVIENGIAANNTWISRELYFDSLPTGTITTLLFFRSATEANLCRLQYNPTTNFVVVNNSGGSTLSVFQPSVETRYEVELYAERGVIAAEAKCHARVATWNGSSYNAPGAWVESNNGTWTDLIDNIRLVFNHNSGVWYMDTYERCQLGPVGDGFCGASAPDAYTTPSSIPNNVYVDNSTVPISESLWSHNGTDLLLQIATDPDLSTIQGAAKPGGTLTLSAAGVLSGTPTASGALNFTARVCDDVGSCATKAFSLDINAAPAEEPPGPWVSSFTPARTHYVDDIACGGVGTIGDPECPSTAVNSTHYQPGDLHIFREGTYFNTAVTTLGKDCTSGNPCVFKAYVDASGQPERARMRTSLFVSGKWNWIVGLEGWSDITGSEPRGVDYKDAGVRVINSVIHDSPGSNLGFWGDPGNGPGLVAYGNVLYRPGCGGPTSPAHNIYSNNLCALGTKYIVHNISLETGCHQQSRRLLQIYDGGGTKGTECYHIEGNLFGDAPTGADNSVIVNDPDGTPSGNFVIKENYFVDFAGSSSRSLRTGQNQPFVGEITGNYFARANMGWEGYWGNSGTRPHIMTFTGNEIYEPPIGQHLYLLTRGVAGSSGSHKIPDADVVDNNVYGGTFKAHVDGCNGTNFGDRTLAQWRTATDGCRVTPGSAGFDLNSTNPANPTTDKVVVIPNQWQCASGCPFTDQARGNIYAVNWDGNTTVSANLSSVVGVGKQYVVRYARDFYGTPAASGTCPGSGACNVSLPTRRTSAEATGQFTNAYVITGEP